MCPRCWYQKHECSSILGPQPLPCPGVASFSCREVSVTPPRDQQRAVWFCSPGTLCCCCLLLLWGKHETPVEAGGGSLPCSQAQSVKSEAGESTGTPWCCLGGCHSLGRFHHWGVQCVPRTFYTRVFIFAPAPRHSISRDPLSLSVAAFLCYLCSSPCWPSRSLALPTNQPYVCQGAKCFCNS